MPPVTVKASLPGWHLCAAVRVLLALLRASGFTLAGGRLPEGAAKAALKVGWRSLRRVTRMD